MKQYRLTLFAGEPDEEIVYAHLSEDDVTMILKDMNGELNYEYTIVLDNGDIIDVGIVDYIDREIGQRAYYMR